ncbi:VQ motif-containing protein [Melia azedarach]|uniref:VQ motif-containing protein n=1 Tax=Melia azedarach TaxID=155640 RepID=A0ACC1WSP6_MELAZ|nr:VQ motif-containing protein [Melia azedarach]
MDPSDFPVSKSPRRELQGPRPAPLKVRKESYKIRKPPVAPQPSQHHHHQHPPQAPPRRPVIIYTVSPKVIHTNPSEFMTLVQRLTGSSSSSSSTTTTTATTTTSYSSSTISYDHPLNDSSGAISPAARYASIEKTKTSPEKNKKLNYTEEQNMGFMGGIEMDHNIERSSFFPGILSPGPTSLPMISPSFFSPPSDPNSVSFFHDLSPVLHGNKNFMEGSFMPSPSFISPYITSPTPSIDLFNNFFDY